MLCTLIKHGFMTNQSALRILSIYYNIQYFTTALRTAVAVPLMYSLLFSISLWDCGPQWQSIYTDLICYTVFHYGTVDCSASLFNVFIIVHSFTMGLRTTVAVFIILFTISLWDRRLLSTCKVSLWTGIL